jgi:hypothetical protein
VLLLLLFYFLSESPLLHLDDEIVLTFYSDNVFAVFAFDMFEAELMNLSHILPDKNPIIVNENNR